MNKGSFLKIFIVIIFASAMAGLLVLKINEGSIFSYFELENGVFGFHKVEESLPEEELSFLEEGIDEASEEEPARKISEGDVHYQEGKSRNDPEMPEPLESLVLDEDEGEQLTVEGIAYYTNQERTEKNIKTLTVNEKLNSAARIKLNDMFDKCYFAHYDPDGGMGVATLAEMVEYESIIVGENLALGHFEDDEDLVSAWMGSPGHRENILKEDYSEIGVAAALGEYEGREVWIAVQIFGRPVSDCPMPDYSLEMEIEENRAVLQILSEEIKEMEADLSEKTASREEYVESIEYYNSLVEDHNELLEETKMLIERFNTQVEIFNDCAGS